MVTGTVESDLYERMLDSMYSTLEALDTSGYQWTTEQWRRDFYELVGSGGAGATEHLACGISIGPLQTWGNEDDEHEAVLVFAARIVPAEDSVSQARLLAAQRHAMMALLEWDWAGCRAVPTSSEIDVLSDEWALVTITFTLSIDRS